MQYQVCTRAQDHASQGPFVYVPPDPMVSAPEFCACGSALEMEMERDLGECVDCQAEAAGLSNRRPK